MRVCSRTEPGYAQLRLLLLTSSLWTGIDDHAAGSSPGSTKLQHEAWPGSLIPET